MRLSLLFALLLAPLSAAAADLVFHYPDSGAPPWLYLTPGSQKPGGIVAEVVEAAARKAGRGVKYEFQPRESAGQSLVSGSAGGALFFSATRPAPRGVALSQPLLKMDTVLVTPKDKPLRYLRPAELANQRLCALTDDVYPPLVLLDMSGKLLLRKAKTEQAQLLMLRNEDCVAAVINGPMYRWLAARYRWDDLRIEEQPLLTESLVLGFGAADAGMAAAVDEVVGALRKSGELDRILQRHLPGGGNLSAR